jgi:hypothetical protein
MNLNELYTWIEDATGEITVPDIADAYRKAVWMQGRDTGMKRARDHIRHNIGEKLPRLTQAPKRLRQEMGDLIADYWLSGHEAAMDLVEQKINVFIFHATDGQALVARFSR